MATRTDARRAVVSILFAQDCGNPDAVKLQDAFFEEQKIRNKQREFAKTLLSGAVENLDAIDDIKPKVQLIKKYYKKLISTTGSAKRIDPTKIQYINIFKTFNDPFARKIRDELKKERFNKNFKVVFSDELPQCKEMGSFVGVTGSFGLTMCSLAIKKLLSEKQIK